MSILWHVLLGKTKQIQTDTYLPALLYKELPPTEQLIEELPESNIILIDLYEK